MNEGFDKGMVKMPLLVRVRQISSGLTLGLGLLSLGLYLLFFRPATAKITGMEADLEQVHREITETGYGHPVRPGAYLDDARAKLGVMRKLAADLSDRAEFHRDLEELLTSRFSVLEYEQRRFDIQQALIERAEEQGASLSPDLFTGLPSYATTTEQAQLLWLHLEFFNHVMAALLTSGQDLTVDRVESFPILTRTASEGGAGSTLEVQLRLQVRGPTASLTNFLNGALPGGDYTGAEANQGYNISHLDLQRVADSADGHVILDILLSGFMLRELEF